MHSLLSSRNRRRWVAVVLLLGSGSVWAQIPMEEMSASGLLNEATRKLSSEQYGAAIPYLEGYLDRMDGVEEERVLILTQKVRLKLGKLMAWLEDPAMAVDYLKEYTATLPLYRPREAFKLLAVNLYAIEEYHQAIAAATNALACPLPKGLPSKTKKKVDLSELSDDERGGFTVRQLKRIEAEIHPDEQEALASGLSEKIPDLETDYTLEELILLNMTLAEAHAALENWPESIEPYKFVIENARAEDRKGFAVMQMVNALIMLERFDEASAFIVELSNTNARYDIRVNMAMMSAATALFDAQEYDSALQLYRMILPRQKLVDYQTIQMNQVRRDTGLPEVVVNIITNETGRVETMFGSRPADFAMDEGASELSVMPKSVELIKLEEVVGMLASLKPYENEVLYRVGLLYARSGRPWEAVTALDMLFAIAPESSIGQRSFAECLMVLIDPLKRYDEVDVRGLRYLETHIEGLGPRMVAHALTRSYQKQEHWEDIKKLRPVIDNFVYSDEVAVRQYECELFYMQAIADMVLLNYPGALRGFQNVLTEYPDSQQEESSTYWHAISQLFLKNHQDALDELDAYAKNWPNGKWLPSAAFHSGLCLFGLEQLDAAQERFTTVIETWPESKIYPDACSLRADLLASQGLLDEAQSDYEEAIRTAGTQRQAAYAVFQLASMFEIEERYEEILGTIGAYLSQYGEEADVAKATYWIGKTKLAQGLMDEAVEAYCTTIIQYGGDVQQDGVDLIISELLTLCRRLTEEQHLALQDSLRTSLNETENVTLQLRLRVLLAEMDGSASELGRQLIVELEDLTQVPPPVLAAVCEASFKEQDYSRAEEMLAIFQTRFENSEFMRAAFKLRGFGLFDAERYDEALEIANEAQAVYGTDVEVVWAQLLRGQIHLVQNDFLGAKKLFRTVLTVSQWRGEPYAEATYYLGRVDEAAGNLREAFAWYQRTYFQYKGLAGGTWAAEGYLASARCLKALGRDEGVRNTYRAMLFDTYVNTLPQAEEARSALGAEEVVEISMMMAQGVQTNVTVRLDAEVAQ